MTDIAKRNADLPRVPVITFHRRAQDNHKTEKRHPICTGRRFGMTSRRGLIDPRP
jgi:hypothetical protein